MFWISNSTPNITSRRRMFCHIYKFNFRTLILSTGDKITGKVPFSTILTTLLISRFYPTGKISLNSLNSHWLKQFSHCCCKEILCQIDFFDPDRGVLSISSCKSERQKLLPAKVANIKLRVLEQTK